MKNAEKDLVRLKKMFLQDDLRLPSSSVDVMKKELSAILGGYFRLSDKPVELKIEVDENKSINIDLHAEATAAKPVKTI